MASLNLAQMTEAVAVLTRMLTLPVSQQNEVGAYVSGANKLVIPLSSHNSSLGSALTTSQDGTNIYIALNPGDGANGTGSG